MANYDPVLYIGNDGKLHAEWLNGGTHPLSSTGVVDDGLWHHVVLSTVTSGGGYAGYFFNGEIADITYTG